MALTKAQQWALVLAPKMTGVCSIVFSSLVIYTVLICPDKRSKTYHRLVLGISCVDISSSFWLAMSTWPIPKEEETNNNTLWAVGTTTTCTIQGFFTQFVIASSFYNASLSIFYLLVIRYGWKDDRIRRLEPLFHCLSISWGLITAIVGLPLTLFNNANLWCWIAPYQDRGESAELYRWLFFYGPLWFMILVVTMNVLLIFQHVNKLERVTQRHSFTPQATTVLSARRITTTVDYERSNEPENNGGTVVVLQQEEVARHDDDDEQMEEDDDDDDNEQDLDDDSLDDETKEEEQQQQQTNNNHHHSKEFTSDSGLGGNVPTTSAAITNGLAQDEDDAAAAAAAVVTTPAVVASSNIPKGLLLFRLSRNNWTTNSVALSSLCTGGTSRTHVIQNQQQQQQRPTRQRRKRRSQKVANQSLRYAGSLYFTWTALTVGVCVCVSLSLWLMGWWWMMMIDDDGRTKTTENFSK